MANLDLTCNNPPGALVGSPYSHTFGVSGGTPPYIWMVDDTTLPDGLFEDRFQFLDTGTIRGTPTGLDFVGDSHVFNVQIGVITEAGDTGSLVCQITVYRDNLPLAASCNGLPGGAVGVPYNHAMAAVGGVAPYLFTITSGGLPDGLSLAGDGTISGTPTTLGIFAFFVHVAGSGAGPNNSDDISCSISIGAVTPNDVVQMYFWAFGFPAPLSATCGDPPDAVIGAGYMTFTGAFNGSNPYTFSLISGALPAGLGIDPVTGLISGTPTGPVGSYPYGVRVTDADDASIDLSCSITVRAAMALGCGSPPAGVVGVPYSHTLDASGGIPPYTFSVIAGALPNGLSLNASTGEITGTPTVSGSFGFTVHLVDSYQGGEPNTADVVCSISVTNDSGLMVHCDNPPAGQIGVFYSHKFPVFGGTAPYTWSIVDGALPPGLTLDSATGIVSGIPTTSGFYEFTVQVADSDEGITQVECSIRIKSCLLVEVSS